MRATLLVTALAALLVLNFVPSANAKPARSTKAEVAASDVPRAVQRTMDDQRGKQDIEDVFKFTESGKTWYRVHVSGGERERLIYIEDNGKLMTIKDVTPEGSTKVNLEALSRKARNAITAAAGGEKVYEIDQITKDGKTVYLAHIKHKGVICTDETGADLDEDEYVSEKSAGGTVTPAAVEANGRLKDQVAFTDMPEAVRRAVDENRGKETVVDCIKFTEGKAVWYRVRVADDAAERLLYFSSSGRLMTTKNATPEGSKEIALNDVPEGAARAIRDAGGKVLHIMQITEGGRQYYKAQIKGKGFLIVDANGKVMDDDDYVKPSIVPASIDDLPGPVKGKHISLHPGRTQREMGYSDLPGKVREQIGHHVHGDKVDDCWQVQEAGKTWYRARINSNTGRETAVYVWSDGTLIATKDVTPDGTNVVKYDELSGNVKAAINDEARGAKILRIVQITENRRTTYRVRIEGKGTIVVDDAGNVYDED